MQKLPCQPPKKRHDTLSVLCLLPGLNHLALTYRKGSLHQQLSAPFSPSAGFAKNNSQPQSPLSLLVYSLCSIATISPAYMSYDYIPSLFNVLVICFLVLHRLFPCPDRKKATAAGE